MNGLSTHTDTTTTPQSCISQGCISQGPHNAPTGQSTALLVVNKDWYFLSHRVPLAQSLRAAGYHVIIAAGDTGRAAEIRALGFTFEPVPFDRGSINPFREIKTVLALRALYKRSKPHIINQIALKAYLFGSLALMTLPARARPPILNTITGQGYLFLGKRRLARLLRAGVVVPIGRFLRRVLKPVFIVFNQEDRRYLSELGLTTLERCHVVPGSGVDVHRFTPENRSPSKTGQSQKAAVPSVIFCARLLRMKGVEELVAASQLLKQRGVQHRLLLCGAPDSSNRDTISEAQIHRWKSSGAIEYLGFRKDTPALLANADIAVLPSHGGEGIPLFLLEAMASGIAIIGTAVPGIKDIISDGDNGLLVPIGDVPRLAEALEQLILNPELCREMGVDNRKRALEVYSAERVGALTVEIFNSYITTRLGLDLHE